MKDPKLLRIQETKPTKTGIVIIIIALIMLAYTFYDAFKINPEIESKVVEVRTEFMELKTYLDKKLPEIDSVLVIHTNQIEEQNKQLGELNTLTSVLKEK